MRKRFLSLRYKNNGKSAVILTPKQLYTRNKIILAFNQGILRWEYSKCTCSVDNDLTLSLKERRGLEYRIVICKNCGLIRANPRISEDTINTFYKNYYRNLISPKLKQHNKEDFLLYTFKEELERGKGILKFIRKHTNLTKGIVFDLGAGTGGVLEIFKNKGYESFGVDLNESYLSFGLKRGLNLKKGSINELKNYPKKANLIIASHILEHLHNIDYYLRGLWECLEYNSYLFVALPGLFKVQEMYRSLQPYFVIEHLYYFTLLTLRKTILRNGFKFIAGNEDIIAIFQKSKKKYNLKISKEAINNILLYLQIVDVPLPFNAIKIIKNKNIVKYRILISLISLVYKTNLINFFAIIRDLLGKKIKAKNLKPKNLQLFSIIQKFL